MGKHKKKHLSAFDTTSVAFDTNLIPYPIGNPSGNAITSFFTFSEIRHLEIYDVMMSSKMATFENIVYSKIYTLSVYLLDSIIIRLITPRSGLIH